MCGDFCTGFIDFMLKGKILLDYTNLVNLKKFKKFKNFKNPKISYIFKKKKKLVLYIICSKCENAD